MIIGQKNLIEKLNILNESSFPRFVILVGARGSGKHVIARYISKLLSAAFVSSDIKVDAVREVIRTAYHVAAPTLYLLPEMDKMSPAAKNALLKVTEEPPRQAFFVLTATDVSSILATLKSRGTVLFLDNYSQDELLQYITESDIQLTEEEENIVLNICSNFLEIDLICDYGIVEFYEFCKLTAEHVSKVNLANAMKIGNKLKFKEEGEGYDPVLFLKTVIYILSQKIREEKDASLLAQIKITSKILADLRSTGINKAATIDAWVIEMQEAENG